MINATLIEAFGKRWVATLQDAKLQELRRTLPKRCIANTIAHTTLLTLTLLKYDANYSCHDNNKNSAIAQASQDSES